MKNAKISNNDFFYLALNFDEAWEINSLVVLVDFLTVITNKSTQLKIFWRNIKLIISECLLIKILIYIL